MGASRTLVLWDIDHTLLSLDGIGKEVYADAFRVVVGRPVTRVADMAGRTERAITAETLEMHGVEVSDALLDSFGVALAEAFVSYEVAMRERGRVLLGAREALEALAGRVDVVQSVLTGNMEPLAVGKLAAFGLDGLVDFEVGAFGMDHEDRSVLVGLARGRAERKYEEPFGADNTVLVGDTPNDVLAGHLGGARVVAVATGASDVATLREAGAEFVLEDLSDTDAVVRAVLRVVDQ
jgi:phosphoglycolate phosphatase-like HAD superfamily hydrolase